MPGDAGIICLSKDWDEAPTSNHHVLRELARSRRVLWLNSVGTRRPRLSSSRDVGKLRRKLVEFSRGPVRVEHDLWVFSPLALPAPRRALTRHASAAVLRATVAALRRRLAMPRFQLWTFLPTASELVGTAGEDVSVYYCVDEWSLFTALDGPATVAAERRLLRRVDCVFAVNDALAEAKRAHNPRTFLAPHGVDHALFARALAPQTVVPADLAALPGPVIGFFGTLEDWVDRALLAELARRRPGWTFALIGPDLVGPGPLAGLPNVHRLGRRPHDQLPAYCKGFAAGLIPYRAIPRMRFVEPLKLREYLSAGLPVISTPVPGVERRAPWCAVGHDADALERALAHALAHDTPALRHARSAAMAAETWAARAAEVAGTVDDLVRTRTRTRSPEGP